MGDSLKRCGFLVNVLTLAIEYIAGLKHDRDAMQYEIDALRRQIHQQR
jgi:hypothetical protein